MRTSHRCGALLLLVLVLLGNLGSGGGGMLEGDYFVHDPSTILRCNGKYWLYSTGRGCRISSSPDLVHWSNAGAVFAHMPEWLHTIVPANRGDVWAPDIRLVNRRYCLYYAVSTFGSNRSAIGLATNSTLDPDAPGYGWTDQGIVVASTAHDNFNAIDPCPVTDASGALWLSYGSFWSGIKLIQLDPKTGKRIAPDSPVYAIAQRPSPDALEASCILRHGGYYYLFVNWDYCCRGINSTYNIRIGRSRKITGPYLDKSGIDMRQGGGTLFFDTDGNGIGPGSIGFLQDHRVDCFSYHYYDANANGRPTLGIRRLIWEKDGWPTPGATAMEPPFGTSR